MTPSSSKSLSGGLLKWKGVVFSQDQDDDDEAEGHENFNNENQRDNKNHSNHENSNNQLDQEYDEDDEIDLDQVNDEEEFDRSHYGNSRIGSSHSSKSSGILLHRRSSPDGRESRGCDGRNEISNNLPIQLNGEQVRK